MIEKNQLHKPDNWKDFEFLCKKLWGEMFKCPESIKKNGRSGQVQNGVDLCGILNGVDYFGIQCEGKEDYTNSILTKEDVDREINKALTFKPQLKRFVFATTADKDGLIEEYIRIKHVESVNKGGFEIDIFSWEDIVDLIEENMETYNWYLNNYHFKDSFDVDISINSKKEYEINPQYIRTTKKYILNEKGKDSINPVFSMTKTILRDFSSVPPVQQTPTIHNVLNPPTKRDYRWCDIMINIKNTGSRTIEDNKLNMIFEADTVEKIDDKYTPFNPGIVYDVPALAQENIQHRTRREVFESKEYIHLVEFIPLNKNLIQEDCKNFKIALRPKQDVFEIKIHWELKARDYSKEGDLKLIVSPIYKEEIEKIYVDSVDELIEDEIEILPKIVMTYN